MIPKKKKTPEEIARLREEMGLVPPSGGDHRSPSPKKDSAPPSPSSSQQEPADTLPEPEEPPQPPADSSARLTPIPEQPASLPPPAAPTQPHGEPKPVRSLRRSERLPSPNPSPAPRNPQAASHLPTHRHSDSELNYIRRAQAIAAHQPAGNFLVPLMAHPLLLGAGYASVFLAAILPFIDALWVDISRIIPAILCLAGLGISGFIFLKKKSSLHHAAFIAAIAAFTLVFGALYYFPQLRNAS